MAHAFKLPPVLVQMLGLQPAPALVDTPRYQGFVQDAAQAQQVWGLLDAGGWISLTLDDGMGCLPVWAHPADALACARGPWADCRTAAIDLPDFLDHWLPAMDSLGVQVAVQPDTLQLLACVPARVLAWHLQVRSIHFPVPWSDSPPGRATDAPPGEP